MCLQKQIPTWLNDPLMSKKSKAATTGVYKNALFRNRCRWILPTVVCVGGKMAHFRRWLENQRFFSFEFRQIVEFWSQFCEESNETNFLAPNDCKRLLFFETFLKILHQNCSKYKKFRFDVRKKLCVSSSNIDHFD